MASGTSDNNIKTKELLTVVKLCQLRLRESTDIRVDYDSHAIFGLLVKNLDTLEKINEENTPALIENSFGNGETIDSIKEKAFTSLGRLKPTNVDDVGPIQALINDYTIKEYLNKQTEDKQKELLSCFYPSNEGVIKESLDNMLKKIGLPVPDLAGKIYDEQRLIWVNK